MIESSHAEYQARILDGEICNNLKIFEDVILNEQLIKNINSLVFIVKIRLKSVNVISENS